VPLQRFRGDVISESESKGRRWYKVVQLTDMTSEITAQQLRDTRAADEALARAHDFLAETLRARAELMTQMGHEVRTPLNGIVGMTELLLGTGLSDEQREYATATMTSATTLLVVINDVLDFTMLEAGTLELDVGTFELRHLVESIRAAAEVRLTATGATISSQFAPDVPDAVAGDGNRLRHVLTELVGSALDYASDGGVEIRVGATSHGAKRLMLRFEVKAEGALVGDADSVFELSSYAHSATQADRPMAIGLVVSKQLVELMGGEIGVQSAPGEGTTFWFTTPVGLNGVRPYPDDRIRTTPAFAPVRGAARAGLTAQPAGGSGDADRGTRLLIADDDPVSQLVLTRQLQARGYTVDVASNGREALELYGKGDYGAVFMDCQMPELNGYDATRAIREQEGTETHTPIIAMTAAARESDREQCAISGMDDYVAKPLDQVRLDAALARRLPVYDTGVGQLSGSNGTGSPDTAVAPLLQSSVLTDVFRHNSESRGYLIGVFAEESRARISQLAAAEGRGDNPTMQRLSHALKGSAGAVGARRMEQICARVHDAVLEGRTGNASELQGALERCFELTAELLRKGCPESADAAPARG
jgi:signal transduction histidine kinase/HPt (histidine-containing phosphotransfer) domain-containing protein/ActR/RegA family two-component response regulator